MTEREVVTSKVVVCEDSEPVRRSLKSFCLENHLMPLRGSSERVLRILRTNIDLGGVLLCGDNDESMESAIEVARVLNKKRPELPLVLRINNAEDFSTLGRYAKELFVDYYTLHDLDKLRDILRKYIFNYRYPTELVRIIHQITKDAILSEIKHVEVKVNSTFLINDNYNFGELVSLISLDSNPCKGYLMNQIDEVDLMDVVAGAPRYRHSHMSSLDNAGDVLNEITNLIWGGLKNRIAEVFKPSIRAPANSVPIIGNQKENYMSFGMTVPKLCIEYKIQTTVDGESLSSSLHQVLVIDQIWVGGTQFQKDQEFFDKLVNEGELELF